MPDSADKLDLRQFKALLRAGYKTDLRGTKDPFASMTRKSRGIPPLIGLVAFYLLIGVVMAVALVARSGDFFVGALFLCGSVMTFVAISVLLEYSSLILSPEDWDVIAPQPVSSKTFFAAKLGNLLLYVGMLAGALGLPPAMAYGIWRGEIATALVLFVAVLAAAVTTAAFVVLFYTIMLRLTDRDRMNSALSYLQLLLITAFYAMMIVLPRQISGLTQSLSGLAEKWWIYVLPPTWFASLPSLLVEPPTLLRLLAAAAGPVVLALFLILAVKRLSLGYARSLAEAVSSQRKSKETRLTSRWALGRSRFMSPEDRVVSRLIKAQFKHDNRFKVRALTAIPLAALYFYLGLSEGERLIDPFLDRDLVTGEGTVMVYIAVALLPVLLIGSTVMSGSYQAAWVFITTPANRLQLVLATKRFVMLYFCLPFLVVVFALMTYYFGNAVHALLHAVVLYLLCFVGATVMLTILGKLPFSVPPRKGSATGGFVLAWLLPMILVVPPMIIISKMGYGSHATYAVVVVALVFLSLLLTLLQNAVISKRVANYELVEE